jgi:hypothetical protein
MGFIKIDLSSDKEFQIRAGATPERFDKFSFEHQTGLGDDASRPLTFIARGR